MLFLFKSKIDNLQFYVNCHLLLFQRYAYYY